MVARNPLDYSDSKVHVKPVGNKEQSMFYAGLVSGRLKGQAVSRLGSVFVPCLGGGLIQEALGEGV